MAVPNYFRGPRGPGWTLVGDAGDAGDAGDNDFITAQGTSDAFRDAELCADRPQLLGANRGNQRWWSPMALSKIFASASRTSVAR